MDDAVSRLPRFLRRNLDSVRNHVHALAGYCPACEISRDCLAVGYPGSRIARDSTSKERAQQPLAMNDREVEVSFAASPRLHDDRLAEPLSCNHRRKRMQAAMDDVNQVIAQSVSPQPGGDAEAPTQE